MKLWIGWDEKSKLPLYIKIQYYNKAQKIKANYVRFSVAYFVILAFLIALAIMLNSQSLVNSIFIFEIMGLIVMLSLRIYHIRYELDSPSIIGIGLINLIKLRNEHDAGEIEKQFKIIKDELNFFKKAKLVTRHSYLLDIYDDFFIQFKESLTTLAICIYFVDYKIFVNDIRPYLYKMANDLIAEKMKNVISDFAELKANGYSKLPKQFKDFKKLDKQPSLLNTLKHPLIVGIVSVVLTYIIAYLFHLNPII
jgi:hypothetical protein